MPHSDPLRVGIAAGDITPELPVPLSGFAIRTAPANGVHDRLKVRGLALDDGSARGRALILVFDWIGVDRATARSVARAVARSIPCPTEHVLIVASHTHGGPPTVRSANLGRVDPDYLRRSVLAAVAVAERAWETRSAELRASVATAVVPSVASNRRRPGGATDPIATLLRIRRAESPIGGWAHFACHSVTLGPDNLEITADYPGFLVARLAERWGCEDACGYLPGLSGQINTGHSAYDSQEAGPRSEGRTFAAAERIGHRIADALIATDMASDTPLAGPVRVATRPVRLRYDLDRCDDPHCARRWRRELDDPATPRHRRAILRTWLDGLAAQATPPPKTRNTIVSVLAVGPALFTFHPGEPFVESALDLRARFPGRPVVPIGYAQDAPGYLPNRDAYAEGGYEVDQAHRVYSGPAPFAPGTGERVHAAVVRAAADLA